MPGTKAYRWDFHKLRKREKTMSSRLHLSIAALLAAFAFPAVSQAADTGDAPVKRHHAHHHYLRYGEQGVGGHRYWYQNTPFTFNDQNSAPGYYNNQTFQERVESQRNYPIGY